jgi:ubiquinone/menaquinone biosynthesis C-methylase UbiE
MNVLELNCGTGEDAVWLAQKGHRVTATDFSGKMIERCNEKIRQCHLENLVTAQRVAFRNLRMEFHDQSFDLVFSDFGGLNCISKEDIGKVAEDIAGFLKPGQNLLPLSW